MKSWFDWRATALALVLAAAAALPFMTTSVESRDYYFFDVTLTSSAPGTTQVFWDLGRGYNENDSSRQPLKVEPKPVVYRYMMPMGDIRALRFDPTDGVSYMSFSHAQIVDYRGKVVRKFSPADFKAINDLDRLYVQGDTVFAVTKPAARDAVIELPLGGPLHLPSSGRIWLRHGLPVAIPVFLLGLVLGLPAVATRLSRGAAALGRWARERPGPTIALAAGLAVAVQCHPVIFQGRSFASPNNGALMLYGQLPTLPGATQDMYTSTMSSDTGALLFNHVYYPMVQRDALLKYGELPLWNRNSLCGEPLLGQGQSMFGDPFNFLTILADGAAWAWDVRFLIAHWLFAAGLGFVVWRFTRHLAASLLVTVVGAFIGFFTYRLVHPANFSVCYSPWILWAWAGLIPAATPRRQAGWLVALVATNWLEFTSGTVKEAYMAMICLNFAGVLLLLLLPVARAQRGRILGLAAAAGAGFVLLSAPGWLSFLVSLKHSFTGYDVPVAHALPLAQVIGFFDDIFYRQTSLDEIVVAPALNFVFLLGVLWWLVRPRLWRGDRPGLALVLAALPPFVLAFGLIPAALIVKIPFLGNIHHLGDTFSCPLLVIAAVLAGCGFRDALEQVRTDGWWRRLGLVFLLTAGLATVFFLSARGHEKSAFFAGYAPELAVALVALPAGLRWALRSGRTGSLWVVLVIALPMLLWRHCQFGQTQFDQYAFVPGLRTDLHAPSPAAAYIDQQRHDPVRVVGWGNNLFPSYNSALRWESLYGVDALRSRPYEELARAFDLQRVWLWNATNETKDAARLIPAHDLMNVDYYVADHMDPPQKIPGLTLLKQLDLDVYASPTVWPRAFFCDRVVGYGTPDDFVQLVKSDEGRPFAAVQEPSDHLTLPPSALAIDAPPAGRPAGASWVERTVRAATDYHLTSNDTTFTIDATGPGLAVLTETYYAEDFRVTVDGKTAPYFRVNHAFKGVTIESAGRHVITFAYWPQYFTASLILAAAGLVLSILGFAWLWRMRPDATAGEVPA